MIFILVQLYFCIIPLTLYLSKLINRLPINPYILMTLFLETT